MSAAAVIPVLHHYLFILAPKRTSEQTFRIFLLGQGREDVAKLQPSANLCLYCLVLYFIYKKGEKDLFEGKLLFSNFNTKEEILQGVQDTHRDLAYKCHRRAVPFCRGSCGGYQGVYQKAPES